MNRTRVATSLAKPISWVTTIIVIPDCASSFIIDKTSPTISGSKADVGSSNNNILGSIKLYEKLHNPSYVEYVHCDDILNRAVSKNENYESVSKYMSEEIYNNLSIKTKSFYKPN